MQLSLPKELATQQTFWELQNGFRPKVQNKLGELDVLLKLLLITETNTYSSDNVPLPLEDDDPIGTEGLPVEDPEDHNQPPEYKEYHPHWESLTFGQKLDLRRHISIANTRARCATKTGNNP